MERFPVTNELDLVDRHPLHRSRKARGRERTALRLPGTSAGYRAVHPVGPGRR